MDILIENEQKNITINENISGIIKTAAELCLKLEGFTEDCELSVLLVDDEQIREINREHRHIDKSTDVLSFPMLDIKDGKLISLTGDFDIDRDCLMLGDIVISLDTAKRQAEDYGHSFERELAFLVTHGMYHLLGYDHEEPDQEKVMLKKQEDVLEQMRLKRNQEQH